MGRAIAKKTRKFVTHKLIKINYVEFKKYLLHVKLTVYYTVSFTCNIHFLTSTYFILINLRVTSFRFSFAAGYIKLCKMHKRRKRGWGW